MRQLDQDQLMRALNGSPRYLGVIASTTVKTNADTAVPFTIKPGSLLLLVPSAAVNVLPGFSPAITVTTANGIPLTASEKFYMLLKKDVSTIQVVGTANTSVWEME